MRPTSTKTATQTRIDLERQRSSEPMSSLSAARATTASTNTDLSTSTPNRPLMPTSRSSPTVPASRAATDNEPPRINQPTKKTVQGATVGAGDLVGAGTPRSPLGPLYVAEDDGEEEDRRQGINQEVCRRRPQTRLKEPMAKTPTPIPMARPRARACSHAQNPAEAERRRLYEIWSPRLAPTSDHERHKNDNDKCQEEKRFWIWRLSCVPTRIRHDPPARRSTALRRRRETPVMPKPMTNRSARVR